MTIDPAIVVAFIGALVGLLGLTFKAFMSGALHPRSTVPREDYEALRAINAENTGTMRQILVIVKKLAVSMDRIRANGSTTTTEEDG